mgnify:CR=1 FL=1
MFTAPNIAPRKLPLSFALITEPIPSTIPPGPNIELVPPPKIVNGEGSLS